MKGIFTDKQKPEPTGDNLGRRDPRQPNVGEYFIVRLPEESGARVAREDLFIIVEKHTYRTRSGDRRTFYKKVTGRRLKSYEEAEQLLKTFEALGWKRFGHYDANTGRVWKTGGAS